jgi:hypothetical protein
VDIRREEQGNIRVRVSQALSQDNPKALTEIIEDCKTRVGASFQRPPWRKSNDYYRSFGISFPIFVAIRWFRTVNQKDGLPDGTRSIDKF